MQRSWRDDEDKCTFIILDAEKIAKESQPSQTEEVAAMVGDVNVFLNVQDTRNACELEIMLAEPRARGRGMGEGCRGGGERERERDGRISCSYIYVCVCLCMKVSVSECI